MDKSKNEQPKNEHQLQNQISQRSNMQSYDMEELEDHSVSSQTFNKESESDNIGARTISSAKGNSQGPMFDQYHLNNNNKQQNPYGQDEDLQTKRNPQLDSFLKSKRIQDIQTQERDPEYTDYDQSNNKLKSNQRSNSSQYDILPGQFVVEPDEEAEEMNAPVKLYVNKYKLCFDGLIITTFYVLSFILYVYIRSVYSLDIGVSYKPYAIIMLVMEALGGTSVILFGICAMFKPLGNRIKWSTKDPPLTTERMYHIRVLIPAYKENLEIVSHTVMASYYAPVPQNCKKTIYLLDDGNSAEKEAWVKQLNTPTIVYVAGRQKKYVEMKDRRGNPVMDKDGKPKKVYAEANGKAENINNALKNYIYIGMKPDQIPLREILCVMDADMIASRPFFMKLVPLLDGGIDIGMILSPQKFHNIPKYQDIFNHSNIHFWEYMLPGFDAMQIIYCTGSNFLMRSRALASCGWFPTTSVTEDYVLGMKMTAKSWKFRYTDEYLATGEAPDNLGQTLQQRSRWTKGPFQILFRFRAVTFFSKDLQEKVSFEAESPLTIPGLTPFQRLMYFQCHWSYIVTVINQLFFLIVPFIAVWVGIFPLNITREVALGMSIYYGAQIVIRYFFRGTHTILPIFFANISGWTLSMCYMKAMFNGSYASITGKVKTFKATSKGTSINKVHGLRKIWLKFITNLRHIWLQLLILIVLILTIAFGGVWIYFSQYKLHNIKQYQILQVASYQEIAIALVWGIFNAVPYWLLIHYSFFGEGKILLVISFLTIFSQIAIYLAIICLLWLLLPPDFLYGQVLGSSLQFLEIQRSGLLSGNAIQTNISWRGDSGLADSVTIANGTSYDLRGGLYNGGLAGHAKSTLPLAFVTTVLAWSLKQFNPAFQNNGQQTLGSDNLQWNLDYLKKAMIGLNSGKIDFVVTQVGSRSRESSLVTWMRPEDMRYLRPVYNETVKTGGADVAAQTAAAFASSSVYYQYIQPSYSQELLHYANVAYQYANLTVGLPLTSADNEPEIIYKQKTINDDMMWAASWLWKASYADKGQQALYAQEIQKYYDLYKKTDVNVRNSLNNTQYVFSYDSLYYGNAVLLANDNAVDSGLKKSLYSDVQDLIQQLICKSSNFEISGAYTDFNTTEETKNCSMSIGQLRFIDSDCTTGQPMDNRKLGTIANMAFLTLLQMQTDKSLRDNKGIVYHCWAETYIKALLGQNNFGRGFVAGYTNSAKELRDKPIVKRQWHRAASCPANSTICDVLNYYDNRANPNILEGALNFQFDNIDDHTHVSNLVSIDNNIGLTAAMAGILTSPFNQNQCWRVQSQRIRRDPICGNLGFTSLELNGGGAY